MTSPKPFFGVAAITVCVIAQLLTCRGASWEGTDDFSSGLSTTKWTLYQYYAGQMLAVGANGHVSFIVPVSSTTRQEAIIGWNGTPTVAEDWTADIRGHNSANWSANDGSELILHAFDTASISTTNILEFGPRMRRGDTTLDDPYTSEFKSNTQFGARTVPATNTNFGLRLVHRGGLSGVLEAWYDPTGNGTAWTLLDTVKMSDFSPSMTATSTFSIGVFSQCYYGPIVEGEIWADNFRLINSAIGTILPQTSLVKSVRPSFSSLMVGTNYQLQVSDDMTTWTNQGARFTATNFNMLYPQYWDVDNWGKLFFRLQPVP